MIDIIFNVETSFNTYPNHLIPIHKDYNISEPSSAFGSLSKTNIFIGENNSGKSRFLRHLFIHNFYSFQQQDIDNLFSSYRKNDVYGYYEQVPNSKLKLFDDIYKKVDSSRSNYSQLESTFFSFLQKNAKLINNTKKFYFPTVRGCKNYKAVIESKLNNALSKSGIQNTDSIRHFINLLSLSPNGLEGFDIYNEMTTEEYFKEQKGSTQVLTGGKLYGEIKSMLLGEEKDRKLIEDFQTFMKETFFSDYETFQLIPNEKQHVLKVKIGNDEHEIYNIGDGTQQLIIMLYSLYKRKDETGNIFFIEEPEMYLHPGILRKFIEIINSDVFKNHQYFITTHSNIILDTSADTDVNMSIFKFKKVKDKEKNNGKVFLIEQCNNGDVSLLNELGVRNSSVFLSNCSIWVEGITDRLYLKHYLGLYNKKHSGKNNYRENIDYTFIEYGGANIVHLNFDEEDSQDSINAKYISNNIFLIADNDNSKEGEAKYDRKQHLKEVLKENFYELSVTEIENLVSKEILKSVLLKNNPKQEEIINKVFEEDLKYSNEHLGQFIDNLFVNTEMKKYSAPSGTIKNKLDFCKSVIESVDDFDKLSDETKDLIDKLYLFIEKHNQI